SPHELTGLGAGGHELEVRAIDRAGNADGTPANHSWTVETGAPDAPQLTSTVPPSPANDNTPLLKGSAPSGADSVSIYAGGECDGPPLKTVKPVELEDGIGVNVPDDTITRFRATATSAAAT